MGGRLDATNVVHPLVSVITRIGMDHMEYLGTDIAAVAREKSGIVKDGRPVVAAPQAEAAMVVIRETCRRRGSPCHDVETGVTVDSRSQTLGGQKVHYETAAGLSGTAVVPLLGRHQLENVATAVLGAEVAADTIGIALATEQVRDGLAAVRWPARLQVLRRRPPLILDAAHNEDGARALVRSVGKVCGGPLGLVVGMCGDKDVERVAALLGQAADRMWTVPLNNPRSADPGRVARASRLGERARACDSLATGLALAEAWQAETGGALCVAGSVFLAGEVFERLGIDPFGRS